jgi:Tol biopolymer transport system component
VTAAAAALLLSGCSTFLFAAFIWTGILLIIPFYVVSLPFYPLYYAVQGLPGDTGSQTAVFSPDGEHLVVAYQQQRHMNLYRVSIESGASQPLTEGDRFDFDPVFAPDGESIVFASRVEKDHSNLFTMTIATREIAQLTSGAYEDWAPQFSPDGGSVVFTRRANETTAYVSLVEAISADVRDLTSDAGAYDIGPVFLPDGESILFARLNEAPKWEPEYDVSWERRRLYTISRDGDNLTQIAKQYDGREHWAERATEERPVVTSYAGNLVLCMPDAVGVLHGAGVRDVQIRGWVEELRANTTCTFSRDGQRVAFTTCKQDNDGEREYRLHVAIAAGDQSTVIVKKSCEIRDPVFSPNGTRLVFRVRIVVSSQRDHYELWTVRFDGTDLRRFPVSEYDRKDMEKDEKKTHGTES